MAGRMNVIAQSEATYRDHDGRKHHVVLKIGRPQDAGGNWRCPIRLVGLPGWSRDYSVCGEDSLQALMLALTLAGTFINSAANGDPRQFSPWNVAPNFGLPRFPTKEEWKEHREWRRSAKKRRSPSTKHGRR